MLESNGRERKRAFDQTKNNNHQHQKQQRKGRNETKSTLCFLLEEKKVPRRLKSFEKVGEGEGITSNEYQILQDIEKAVNKLGEKVHFILLNKLFPT